MLALPVSMSSGVNAMSTADYRAVIDVVGSCSRFFNSEKTKPGLHLIKQVEQVTRLCLEAPPALLPGFGAGKSGEDDDPHISN
jgi:hypothetical protein